MVAAAPAAQPAGARPHEDGRVGELVPPQAGQPLTGQETVTRGTLLRFGQGQTQQFRNCSSRGGEVWLDGSGNLVVVIAGSSLTIGVQNLGDLLSTKIGVELLVHTDHGSQPAAPIRRPPPG